MSRVLIDLSDDDLAWLDARAKAGRRSRAAVLREAVSVYRTQAQPAANKDWLDQAFGAWKDRTDIGDSVEWQRRERASWTRPWDDDYDDVRAEFPDLFDDYDNRERARYLAMTRTSDDDGEPSGS